MARTPLTVQKASSSGGQINWTTANVDGHSFSLSTGLLLLIRNTDVASITATVPTPATVDGLAVSDQSYTVESNTIERIALRGNSVYAQADGSAWVNFSAVTNVDVALIMVR